MAVLAALGGVTSTYINTLGDAVEAFLGSAGGSQWAAGLHVIWIVLAMGITGKPGTGIFIGLLKGFIELLSGNSHGIIILLVDLVAGLLVDFSFLLFRNKRSLFPYLIAGGLASGSNVIVFQIFATVPSNILALSAIFILLIVACVSGLLFGGLIPKLLVNALSKANIVKIAKPGTNTGKMGWIVIIATFIIATLMTVYFKSALKGAPAIQINGAVQNPYKFPIQDTHPEMVTRKMEYKGVMTEYTGYLLKDALNHAKPVEEADTVLITASDGYSFMISFEELESNPNILVIPQGQAKNTSYDIVGPESNKAWIRGIMNITIITSKSLVITAPSGEFYNFDPDKWVSEMDSTQVNLPNGSQKLQGVPVWQIVEASKRDEIPAEVKFTSSEETVVYTWDDINRNDNLRIFTVIEDQNLSFVLANMSGEVYLFPVTKIEID